jgi:hypothetical protein
MVKLIDKAIVEKGFIQAIKKIYLETKFKSITANF